MTHSVPTRRFSELYLVHTAMREGEYTIFGYKGKQVRDQIHSADVISAFWAFAQDPRPGEAYNLGGGKANAASLLECVDLVAEASGGKRPNLTYDEQRSEEHTSELQSLMRTS